MSDSEAVEINLDDFEKDFYSNKPVAEEPEVEVSEPTPSATNENESEPEVEADEDEAEEIDGDDAPEAEEDESEKEEKPKRKRRSAQERIDDLTREKYELQRLLDLERQERNRKSQEPENTKTPTVQPPVGAPQPDALNEDGTPVYVLGEFDPQFITDLNRYVVKQEFEAMKKEEAEKEQALKVQQAQKELTDNWAKKVEESAERLPNLKEKFGILEDTFKTLPPQHGEFLASSIMMLENGPDVLDYFADNLDEAKGIVNAGLFETIIALGALDEQFRSAKKSKDVEKGSVNTTQAPPPPPLRTRGSASVKTIRPDTPDLDDFEKIFYE